MCLRQFKSIAAVELHLVCSWLLQDLWVRTEPDRVHQDLRWRLTLMGLAALEVDCMLACSMESQRLCCQVRTDVDGTSSLPGRSRQRSPDTCGLRRTSDSVQCAVEMIGTRGAKSPGIVASTSMADADNWHHAACSPWAFRTGSLILAVNRRVTR